MNMSMIEFKWLNRLLIVQKDVVVTPKLFSTQGYLPMVFGACHKKFYNRDLAHEWLQVQGAVYRRQLKICKCKDSCPGTKVALDLMLIQFEASYDMGKQTIEGPKENDDDLNTFEVPMVQNCTMLDRKHEELNITLNK